MTLSIIYVYYNTPKEIINSIKSIKQAIGSYSFEVIVVDNASKLTLSDQIIKNKSIIKIINKQNFGYGKALNQGSKIAKGELILFVNPDTIFQKNSLKKLIERLQKDKMIGIISPQMLNINKKVLLTVSGNPDLPDSIFSFSILNKLFSQNKFSKKYWLTDLDKSKEQVVSVVGGACIMMKKSIFEKAGKFDEQFFMYFEEADLCRKVQDLGLKILYFPQSQIVHFVGRSATNKEWVESEFEKSRFKYFKKYHNYFYAFISEMFLRFTKLSSTPVILILCLSLFINLYKINSLMMFFGDFGKDYLSARDFIIFHHIPLVGIQSSVVWLHQGPISVYLIAVALALGRMNPVAPAILYGILGAITSVLIYFLGKNICNKKVGILGSLFFVASPLAIVNTRMPYHTSLIPFFTLIFFLILQKAISEKRHFFWVFFAFGILLQVELSNAVLGFVMLALFLIKRPHIDKNTIFQSIAGFLLGIIPFILYDLTHHFVQTLGFPLWIVNRIRLFLGLTVSHNATTEKAPSAIVTIVNQITGAVFPSSYIISAIIFCLIIIFAFKNRKKLQIIILWLLIPLCGYVVHAAPSTAYFPVLFPAISLLVGYLFYKLSQYSRIFSLLFFIIVVSNIYITIFHNYFLTTFNKNQRIPPAGYNIGTTWTIYNELAKAIVQDAKGNELQIIGKGTGSVFQTNYDNYRYLALWEGGKLSGESKHIYLIYQNQNDVKKNQNVIFKSKFGSVVKYETN